MGKGCHSNDEREDLIDLGATAHHVSLRRARELIVKGVNGVFLFRSSFFLFVPCLPLESLALLCFCSVLYFPWVFADSGCVTVNALFSTDTLLPTSVVAALLNASVSEDTHRGPYQET